MKLAITWTLLASVLLGGLNAKQHPCSRRGFKLHQSDRIASAKDCSLRVTTDEIRLLHYGGGETTRGGDARKKWSHRCVILRTFASKRLPWLVCTLLSIYYFAIFTKGPVASPYSKDGFCVTGLVDTKCFKAAGNSHQFAWGIDILYTLLALCVPINRLARLQPVSGWFWFNVIAIAALILGHGFLHSVISGFNCNMPGSMYGMAQESNILAALVKHVGGAEVAYGIFVFILMAVDLYGFSSIPMGRQVLEGLFAVFGIAVVLTLVIVKLTVKEHDVSSFFMISQVVVSLTGLAFPNTGTATSQLGWAFILPCFVSILEFQGCSLLVQYGGHSWYDFFLHLSMLVALQFGTFEFPPSIKGSQG